MRTNYKIILMALVPALLYFVLYGYIDQLLVSFIGGLPELASDVYKVFTQGAGVIILIVEILLVVGSVILFFMLAALLLLPISSSYMFDSLFYEKNFFFSKNSTLMPLVWISPLIASYIFEISIPYEIPYKKLSLEHNVGITTLIIAVFINFCWYAHKIFKTKKSKTEVSAPLC